MDTDVVLTRASDQDGTYPRPQLVRGSHLDLGGEWTMRFDDDNVGIDERWETVHGFDRAITVPFPFESPASGIGDTGFHPVVWYHSSISAAMLEAAGSNDRTILHFGAVDYRATAWLNGVLLGHHEGGNTPFDFDVTHALVADSPQSLVVRAEDDPLDVAQPRGKQDWQAQPHSIWYHRTTGIWQPVWLETVPTLSITHLAWRPDVASGSVVVEIELSRRPDAAARVELDLWFGEEQLASLSLTTSEPRLQATIAIPRQSNGQNYEQLLWSDTEPRLIDARVTLAAASGALDTVFSYFGMRSAAVSDGRFMLNDRPVYVRSILSQGYWPESHLAAPSAEALRDEVQLIKDLGFNAARVHQKIEDPRFLFWADKLGLLLWEEMPSVYEFSPTAARRVIAEWSEVVRRDSSHPSIITWVPLNESWGVQHIAHSSQIQAYSRSLFALTHALDGSRPVVSNDGWEHLDTDIFSVHDYEASGEVVARRYADAAAVAALFAGLGPAGRRLKLSDEPERGQPVMLTEFGGIKFAESGAQDAWGYSTAADAADFERRLRSLLGAVRQSDVLAGFCYTQLTDTGQEVNGVVTDQRAPKLPLETLRGIFGARRDAS